MSYRSEVAILFNKRAVERMPEELKKLLHHMFIVSVKSEDGDMVYHDASLKWYPDYEDVKEVTSFMKSLSENEDGGCEFMRIGQDDDDIEWKSYGDYKGRRLWLERSITFEGENIMDLKVGEQDNG